LQLREGTDAANIDLAVVGGAGHVGLPLSLTFANAGLSVAVYDTDSSALAKIQRGSMPFRETGAEELLKQTLQSGDLCFTSDPGILGRTRQVVIVIGTPIDEFLNPSLTIFERTLSELAPHLQAGTLVILRSTVFPGTTQFVTKFLHRLDPSIDVAFCPERIAEGHAIEELTTLPQIIGADDAMSGDRAEKLFLRLGAETIRVTSLEAELAKLFTNAWRYMKFAVANQFFMIAHTAGADYTRVLHAVQHNYPRATDLPSPGFAAGPCLLKDTMQLAAFTADHFPMGQSAMQINESLPAYIVGALERRHGSLRGRTVGILGMAFKAESDDPRASLSYKLRKLLGWAGADVLCTDPFVNDARLIPLDEVIDRAEILILAAPHSTYRSLAIGGKDLVDVWGVTGDGIQL
jgi:UDP-N-acetyl-D-mannosaminuronic acid dehydrogenase